jgi:hypothetical protein
MERGKGMPSYFPIVGAGQDGGGFEPPRVPFKKPWVYVIDEMKLVVDLVEGRDTPETRERRERAERIQRLRDRFLRILGLVDEAQVTMQGTGGVQVLVTPAWIKDP